jgi:hypothetical protein
MRSVAGPSTVVLTILELIQRWEEDSSIEPRPRSIGMARLIGIIVVVWLLIGVLATYQRGYFADKRDVNCKTTSDTVLTVLAGPLNYVGVNPKVKCRVPQPSR